MRWDVAAHHLLQLSLNVSHLVRYGGPLHQLVPLILRAEWARWTGCERAVSLGAGRALRASVRAVGVRVAGVSPYHVGLEVFVIQSLLKHINLAVAQGGK